MHKLILLILLLAVSLNMCGQESPAPSEDTDFVVNDAALVAPRLKSEIEIKTLPSAPSPRSVTNANNGSESADAEGVVALSPYEPSSIPHQPAVPLEKRATVWNKKFIAAHAVFLGAIVYDAELTHQGLAHHKCVEANTSFGTHPSRGEIYGKSLLAFGAIGGMDWLLAKTGIRYVPYVGPAFGSAIHFTGGSKWLTDCW